MCTAVALPTLQFGTQSMFDIDVDIICKSSIARLPFRFNRGNNSGTRMGRGGGSPKHCCFGRQATTKAGPEAFPFMHNNLTNVDDDVDDVATFSSAFQTHPRIDFVHGIFFKFFPIIFMLFIGGPLECAVQTRSTK